MSTINYDELDALESEQTKDIAFASLGNRYVPGEGDNPSVFLIGEAPGATEHMRGRPFVGDAGAILRRLMHLADLRTGVLPDGTHGAGKWAANCWLTNVIKFRPPGNRKPYYIEVMAARPYLRREWAAVGKPTVIVPLGGTALHAVLGKQESILRVAGYMRFIAGAETGKGMPMFAVWPMLHPAYGLHNESARPQMETDWLRLGEWLDKNGR